MTTTQHVKIDSDITGRFKRIINQVEFDGKLTFITELLQNCQRGSATKVNISLDDRTLIVSDNGVGCSDPKDLFTLDFSGFGYGFGEGFSSVYTLLGQVKVKTLDWQAEVDVEKLASKRIIKKEDLEVPISPSDFYQGFRVELTSGKIEEYKRDIEREIRKVSSTMMDIEFVLNGEILSKHDLFEIPSSHKFHELFDNHLYTGRIYVDTMQDYKGIDVYYEDRFVQNLHYNLTGISGNIMVKPNKINLKAPDRKSIIYDEKRDLLLQQLKRNFVTLLIFVLKEGTLDDIEKYADIIRYHIPIEKSMRFLRIDDSKIKNQYETRQEAQETGATDENEPAQVQEESASLGVAAYYEEKEAEFETKTKIEKENEYELETKKEEVDIQRNRNDQHFSSFVSSPPMERVSKENLNLVSISNIKRKSNVVWVERDRAADVEELIAKYEYYGVFTFISPHGLYDDALRHLGITHIERVESDAIEKQYSVKNIGAKNKKEMRAMEVLHMIEKLFNLDETFYISDIECKMTVSLHDKKIHQEKLHVEGYAQGSVIHLNRKSLEFGRLTGASLGKEQIGLHETKMILANIELISHELAHLLYLTKDNTKLHYETIFTIQKKIGQLVLNAE